MERRDNAIEAFCCYAHEDQKYFNQLKMHLNIQNLIHLRGDGDIGAGTSRDAEIIKYLEAAQIILLLISADFFSSGYANDIQKMQIIMGRYKQNKAKVVPIIVRHVNWEEVIIENTKLGSLQTLPRGGVAITTWQYKDEAWKNVAKGIEEVARELQNNVSSKQNFTTTTTTVITKPLTRPFVKTPAFRLAIVYCVLLTIFGAVATQIVTHIGTTLGPPNNTGASPKIALPASPSPLTQVASPIASVSPTITQPSITQTPSTENHTSPGNTPVPPITPTPPGVPTSIPTPAPFIPNTAPIMDDPMNGLNNRYQWDIGQAGTVTCKFNQGVSYDLSAPGQADGKGGGGCNPEESNSNLTNFVYEMHMTINQGFDKQGGAGLAFNWQPNYLGGSNYSINFDADGNYTFGILTGGNTGPPAYKVLWSGNSSSFRKGLGQVNDIAVRVENHLIKVQVNQQQLFAIVDTKLNGGMIGVGINPGTAYGAVSFTAAKVWTL